MISDNLINDYTTKRYWNLVLQDYFIFDWFVYPLICSTKSGHWSQHHLLEVFALFHPWFVSWTQCSYQQWWLLCRACATACSAIWDINYLSLLSICYLSNTQHKFRNPFLYCMSAQVHHLTLLYKKLRDSWGGIKTFWTTLCDFQGYKWFSATGWVLIDVLWTFTFNAELCSLIHELFKRLVDWWTL